MARRYNLKNKAGACKCYLNVNNFHGGTLMRPSIQKQRIYQIYFCVLYLQGKTGPMNFYSAHVKCKATQIDGLEKQY